MCCSGVCEVLFSYCTTVMHAAIRQDWMMSMARWGNEIERELRCGVYDVVAKE